VAQASAAHVHRGAAGVDGAIVADLGASGRRVRARVDLSPSDLANLLAGGLYVDVHSHAFPSGEIRGQVN